MRRALSKRAQGLVLAEQGATYCVSTRGAAYDVGAQHAAPYYNVLA